MILGFVHTHQNTHLMCTYFDFQLFSFNLHRLTENGLAANVHSTKLKNRTLIPSLQTMVSLPMTTPKSDLYDNDSDDEEAENLILYNRESSHDYD